MFEKLDEAQLLALVEGELDTQEAESLRQQLGFVICRNWSTSTSARSWGSRWAR